MRNPDNWQNVLTGLRYDILSAEPLHARKEEGERRVIEVWIIEPAQVRMVLTTASATTGRREVTAASGRLYICFVERNQTVILNYTLTSRDRLREILVEMEREIAHA